MYQQKNQGFTLMEILVSLAIVGILLAIALPQYSKYVMKSRRSDAKVALLGIAQLQEAYYANYHKYATALGNTTNAQEDKLGCKTSCKEGSDSAYQSPEGHYALSIIADNTQRYVIKAVAIGKQALTDEDCQTFVLDSRGRKGADVGNIDAVNADDPDPNACWR